MGAGDSLCDGSEGRIGFAIEPIAVVDYLDLVGPAIPLADEMGAGRNGPCGSGGAVALASRSPWQPERAWLWPNASHGSGTGVRTQENAAHENARERAWRSSPKGLLPDPP